MKLCNNEEKEQEIYDDINLRLILSSFSLIEVRQSTS